MAPPKKFRSAINWRSKSKSQSQSQSQSSAASSPATMTTPPGPNNHPNRRHRSQSQVPSGQNHHQTPRGNHQNRHQRTTDAEDDSSRRWCPKRSPPTVGMPVVAKSEVSYCRESPLGRGSFGSVYKGKVFGEVVAIKFFRERDGVSIGAAWDEFLQEVHMLMGHSHQNVISLKGVCLDPPCIITEYCPNGSLHHFLCRETYTDLSWGARVKLAAGIARGMLFLHSQEMPIIHQDLRCSNIVLKEDFTPVITDLGMATNGPTEPRDDLNPMYQSPEVILRREKACQKSDVYSFSILMWAILTGKIPWQGLNPWVAQRHLELKKRLPVPKLWSKWPGMECYVDLMQRCWAEERQDRPTFREIVQELERILALAGDGPPDDGVLFTPLSDCPLGRAFTQLRDEERHKSEGGGGRSQRRRTLSGLFRRWTRSSRSSSF